MPSAPFIPEVVEDPSWHLDHGATSHTTNDLGKLIGSKSYIRSECLLVGNWDRLQIKQVGSMLLATNTHSNHYFLIMFYIFHILPKIYWVVKAINRQ